MTAHRSNVSIWKKEIQLWRGGAAIVKNAPNLPAAQAMIDLLTSAEFQDAWAEVSAGRGSNGNCNLSGLPAEDTLGMKELDFDYLKRTQRRNHESLE